MRKVRAQRKSEPVRSPRGPRQSQTVPSDGTSRARPTQPSPSPAESQGSASHAKVPELIPAAWLDRLLLAAVELPALPSDRAVVEAMVEALAGILPDHAVGACFAPESGGVRRERIVVKSLPEGFPEAPGGADPARLFPTAAHEYVVPLPGSSTGSTLHVASDVGELLAPSASPVAHLVDRAAIVLARSLLHARRVSDAASLPGDSRSLEERLIQADKLATFGQIAAGLVHELNNPLTSIVAYSDYLIRKVVARGPADDADDVERLRRISESANRMLRFTRDLVHYARPSGGVAGPVVLHEIVDQAAAFCEHVLAGAAVKLERRFGDEALVVRGVSEQLVQVFVNLLTNASQAALPSGGVVSVTTSIDASARRVRVLVHDNGTGIAPEHLPHVFAPFFTTKGDRNGTGLGLSIVKSIVQSHEGEIHVESARGHGTRFFIELPAWQRPV
ncbi:MAG: sensor histidine kinase [Polyangiaceae bacterium]